MLISTKPIHLIGRVILKILLAYRIFAIKRRGRLFKTRPRRPGVFSGPGVYLFSAFFNHLFLSSVLEVY